jgi:hypothetical protein
MPRAREQFLDTTVATSPSIAKLPSAASTTGEDSGLALAEGIDDRLLNLARAPGTNISRSRMHPWKAGEFGDY